MAPGKPHRSRFRNSAGLPKGGARSCEQKVHPGVTSTSKELCDECILFGRSARVVFVITDPIFDSRLLPQILRDELQDNGLLELLETVEMPLARVLAGMELTGVHVDVGMLQDMSSQLDTEIEALTGQIYGLADEEFNVNSPKQLAHILFECLNLPVQAKTKTGYSTNENVLKALAFMHPLPEKVLQLRKLTKLKNTYIVFEKIEEKEARTKQFEEVKNIVRDKLREDREKELAGALAESIMKILQGSAENFESLAEQHNLEVQHTDSIGYDEIPDVLDIEQEASYVFFNLSEGRIADKTFEGKSGYYIIGLTERIFPENAF